MRERRKNAVTVLTDLMSAGRLDTVAAREVGEDMGVIPDDAAERQALDDLFSATYEELKRLAASVKKSYPGATLNPTGIVDEAWVKLAQTPSLGSVSRLHFKRVAAHAMREVLVDAARRQQSQKRGGAIILVTFDESVDQPVSDGQQLLELDGALNQLAALDADQAQVVEYRFFAGMTNKEIAQVMDSSESTVERAWRAASAWLKKTLRQAR